MNKLFGVSKKKEEPKSNPNAPSLTDTSTKVSKLSIYFIFLQLDERGKVVNTKLEACNKELMELKIEMRTAKGMRKKTL